MKIERPLHKFVLMLLERVEQLEDSIAVLTKDKDNLQNQISARFLEDTYSCRLPSTGHTCRFFSFGTVVITKEGTNFNMVECLADVLNQMFKKAHEVDTLTIEVKKFINITNYNCLEVATITVAFNKERNRCALQSLVEGFDTGIGDTLSKDSHVFLTRYHHVFPSLCETCDFIEYQRTAITM